MNDRLLAASAVFVVVSTITPGPNNLMLAASGLAFGFRRTVPLLLGIHAGFQTLLAAVAAGLGALFGRYPAAHWVLRIVGAAYLLHLACMLWRSSAVQADASARPLGFVRGAAFQLVNPKAWMMTLSAVGAYTRGGAAYAHSVLVLAVLFLVLGLPCIALWAAFGSMFRTAFADPATARCIGRLLAVVTGLSCLLVFL